MNYTSNKNKSSKRLYVFAGLLILSVLIIILFRAGKLDFINGALQSVFRPIQIISGNLFFEDSKDEITKLREENSELKKKIIKLQIIEQDNRALRDQFVIEKPRPKNLLPATIISMPSILPRTDTADYLVIDKGSSDNVKINDPVVYKDSLVGKVSRVSGNLSIVNLINHRSTSFTARTLESKATGIIKGTDEQKILFDNVLLADTLKAGDTVIGEFPDEIIIGRIKEINKKASDLFQTAEIEQIIDVKKLTKVFILKSDL